MRPHSQKNVSYVVEIPKTPQKMENQKKMEFRFDSSAKNMFSELDPETHALFWKTGQKHRKTLVFLDSH